MDDEKRENPYEDLQDTVDHYAEGKGEDLLTDSAALAEARENQEAERAAKHGHRIRAGREERGFTIGELAAKTGIGEDLLASVESGETYLPLGQLIKLSKALSMSMSEVISGAEDSFTIVRSGQRQKFTRFGKAREQKHGYEYESLAAGKKDKRMEPFIVTLYPAAGDQPSSHDGQEFIYVLEGEMEVLVEGTREVLKPGDSVYYDSTSLHLVRAHGDKPAKILAVLVG
ncbi:MAG: XRE family transcriptional regulator [Pseudomonadota bacterium]